MKIYDLKVKSHNGKEVSLKDYEGKVLLVVNTATHCQHTPQYVYLKEIYDKFHDQGLEILDFPSDQLNGKAPGTNSEIHDFCVKEYNIEFPQFEKIEVNGENQAPLYELLKTQRGGLFDDEIEYNFTKFLLNRDGEVIMRYEPTIDFLTIERDIKELL